MCTTQGCRNRSKGLCNTCTSRRKREKNPMRYAYDNLKHNTYRRKGKAFFYLTFEEFAKYAIETNYITGKGRTKTSYSIDCIDPTMGYFIGNIRSLTVGNNSKKRRKILNYDWETGYATVETKTEVARNFDDPF